MAKKAIRPRYQPFRAGWYVVLKKKRICLAKGEQWDREVWGEAMRKFWAVTQTPLVGRIKVVDWKRLADAQYEIEPAGQFARTFPQANHEYADNRTWAYCTWEIGLRTEDQIRAALEKAGVTDEMMSLFVPMPERVERKFQTSQPSGPPVPPFPVVPGEPVEETIRRWTDLWPEFRELDSRKRLVCHRIAKAFLRYGIQSDRIPLVLRRVEILELQPPEVSLLVEDEHRLRELAGLGPESEAK